MLLQASLKVIYKISKIVCLSGSNNLFIYLSLINKYISFYNINNINLMVFTKIIMSFCILKLSSN